MWRQLQKLGGACAARTRLLVRTKSEIMTRRSLFASLTRAGTRPSHRRSFSYALARSRRSVPQKNKSIGTRRIAMSRYVLRYISRRIELDNSTAQPSCAFVDGFTLCHRHTARGIVVLDQIFGAIQFTAGTGRRLRERRYRHHARTGLLRNRLRRQYRSRPPHDRRAERRALRQHLERPLFSQ